MSRGHMHGVVKGRIRAAYRRVVKFRLVGIGLAKKVSLNHAYAVGRATLYEYSLHLCWNDVGANRVATNDCSKNELGIRCMNCGVVWWHGFIIHPFSSLLKMYENWIPTAGDYSHPPGLFTSLCFCFSKVIKTDCRPNLSQFSDSAVKP
jgi:hypothetical protein